MKQQIVQGTENHKTGFSVGRKFHAPDVVRLARASMHNGRTGNEEAHVDYRRTGLNDVMVGERDSQYYCNVVNRIMGTSMSPEEVNKLNPSDLHYTDGQKLRNGDKKKSVLVYECEVQYPGDLTYANIDENGQVYIIPEGEEISPNAIDDPENPGRGDFLYPVNMEEFEKWKQLTLEFTENRFGGKDNILQMICHMDEGIPHIHIMMTPIYKDRNGVERLSHSKYINGPKDIVELQTEYAAAVSELGYVRGNETGIYKRTRSTAGEARALQAKAIGLAPSTIEELDKRIATPELKKDLIEDMQALQLKAAVNGEVAKEVPVVQKALAKEQDKNRKLKEELQKKDIEIENYKKQITTLQKEHQRRLCELQGIQICNDKEVVDAYLEYQDKFIDDGARNFERVGMHVDLDFDGHDDRLQNFIDTDKDGHDDRSETE